MSRIPDYPAPARALTGEETIPVWQDGRQIAVPVRLIDRAPIVLTATGNGNNIDLIGVLENGRYYSFASPITSTGVITINDRPLLGADDLPVAAPGIFQRGADVTVAWRFDGQLFRLVHAENRRLDDLTNTIASLNLPRIRSDITLTRDPFASLTQKIMRGAFGTVTYAGGVRTAKKPVFVITSCGNSLMHAYRGDISKCYGEKLKVKLQARMPDWDVQHDILVGQFPVDGAWANQIGAQIDKFPRKPDLVLVGTGQNDAIANIMTGYQGFSGPNNTYGGYEAALERVFEQIDALGCAAVHFTSPYPHPTRSKQQNRFTVTPEVLMTWPQTSLIAVYLRIVFTAANQRISAYAGNAPFDLFNQYGNGLFGAGKYLLEFNLDDNTTGALHKALEVAPDGTWCRVNNTILADKNDGTSVRQANFDNETEVFPPLSQRIVQRDPSGTGALVDMSWGHWEIAKVARRVAQRNAVVTVDHAAIIGRKLTSNAAYDAAFVDDFHVFDAEYDEADDALDALADDIVMGNVTPGRIYA